MRGNFLVYVVAIAITLSYYVLAILLLKWFGVKEISVIASLLHLD